MSRPLDCGIYQFRNLVNDKRYFGQSKRMKTRYLQHRSSLRRGIHRNSRLQNAWNKYGEAGFVFECVEEVENNLALLNEREIYYINKYDACHVGGYNIASGGYLGSPHYGLSKEKKDLLAKRASVRQSGSGNGNYNKELRKHSKEICTLYANEKISAIKLSKMFNVSQGVIKNVLLENDIKIRGKSEAYDNQFAGKYRADLRDKKDDIIKDYDIKKMSRKQIGIKYNATAGTIKTILIENNIYIRSYKEQRAINERKRYKKMAPKILKMHSQGCSVMKIKNMLNSSYIIVNMILKENNIVPNVIKNERNPINGRYLPKGSK